MTSSPKDIATNMVSYYNSFSMFPNPTQPHPMAAAAAARHAQHSPAAMAAAQVQVICTAMMLFGGIILLT